MFCIKRTGSSAVAFCSFLLFARKCKKHYIPELKVQRSALSVAGGGERLVQWHCGKVVDFVF